MGAFVSCHFLIRPSEWIRDAIFEAFFHKSGRDALQQKYSSLLPKNKRCALSLPHKPNNTMPDNPTTSSSCYLARRAPPEDRHNEDTLISLIGLSDNSSPPRTPRMVGLPISTLSSQNGPHCQCLIQIRTEAMEINQDDFREMDDSSQLVDVSPQGPKQQNKLIATFMSASWILWVGASCGCDWLLKKICMRWVIAPSMPILTHLRREQFSRYY